MKKHLKTFLKHHSIDDVKETIIGELNEYSTDDFTAFFGNGELIICDAHSEDEEVFTVTKIGFNEYLTH